MRACSDCFSHGSEAPLAAVDAAEGVCGLCGEEKSTWSAEAWALALQPLLSAFRVDSTGIALGDHLLRGWDLFSERATLGRSRFVGQICSILGLGIDEQTPVSIAPAKTSARAQWERFNQDLDAGSRWFFTDAAQSEFMASLQLCVTMRSESAIDQSARFYRARVLPRADDTPDTAALGAPPAHLATGGRANSPGVPMLYVSTTRAVAVHEVRPTRMAVVHTMEFRPRRKLSLVDFTPSSDRRPNPFFTYENGDPCPPGDIWVASELGAVLGEALSRPLRESDIRVEYLATQYVAEFVRSTGRDGIRFRSSFCAPEQGVDGDNVVIFEPHGLRGDSASVRRHVVGRIVVDFDPGTPVRPIARGATRHVQTRSTQIRRVSARRAREP